MKNQPGLRGARRLIVCQLGVTILLGTIALLFGGRTAAGSALLGGVVCIVPNAYFAGKLFRFHGAGSAKKILNSFYSGEALKIILSIALFTLVFKFFNIIPLIFFAVYIVAQMVFWLSPLIFNDYNGPESD